MLSRVWRRSWSKVIASRDAMASASEMGVSPNASSARLPTASRMAARFTSGFASTRTSSRMIHEPHSAGRTTNGPYKSATRK